MATLAAQPNVEASARQRGHSAMVSSELTFPTPPPRLLAPFHVSPTTFVPSPTFY